MSTRQQGIWNFSKFNDKEKAFTLKYLVGIACGILAGVITGLIYSPEETGWLVGLLGLAIFLGESVLISYFVKMQYKLEDPDFFVTWRHGIFTNLILYLFFWILIFNFFILDIISG